MKESFKLCLFMVMMLISLNHALSEEGQKVVSYRDYGAVGDGVTDDYAAICKAHEAANQAGLPVCAASGATYYIGKTTQKAVIQTNTDWKDAQFIIDDSKVGTKNGAIFTIASKLPTTTNTSVKTIRKNQDKLDITLPYRSLVIVLDKNVKRYIRYGANQNNGAAQTDVFIVNTTGGIDRQTPVIWDFDKVTSMTVIPIDPETLTVTGGHFTTIANQAESRYTYYNRGIAIIRSNVVLDGITHRVTQELDHGAPYSGFITVSKCADIVVRNCKLSGHKIYHTIGRAGRSVSMGSYDISVSCAINVMFQKCRQFNSIHDTTRWGIFGSNFSKNITFDRVQFSRFDAHMGVTNATIKDSILGHQGINLIGFGVFTIENTRVHGKSFIGLRGDYGSTFDGDIIIRNCELTPKQDKNTDICIIRGSNSGSHDFGYKCYMPRTITIDGLVINDEGRATGYKGPKLFNNINSKLTSDKFVEQYPYQVTREVSIKNLVTKSGLPLKISDNPYMFRNVKVTEEK